MRPHPQLVLHAALAPAACVVLCTLVLAPIARGETATLKSGIQVEGSPARIDSIVVTPNAIQGKVQPKSPTIMLFDDELRRVYFPMYQIPDQEGIKPSLLGNNTRFTIPQRVMTSGKTVVSVGPILRVTPFDEYGRRTLTMNTDRGPLDVVQGITEITPTFIKVEGLYGARGALVWSMRIATSSLSREQLSRILLHYVDRQNADQRVKIVQLYIQADRIQDAHAELKSVLADFPQLRDLQEQGRALNQVAAQRMLKEVELRKSAGQFLLAESMLANFPQEGVAGELLLRVRDEETKNQTLRTQAATTLQKLQETLAAVQGEKDRAAATVICEEIVREFSIHNYDRLADFSRLADDSELSADQKLALAISGWLMGSGQGINNLATALSLVNVRNLAREFLTAKRKGDRETLLKTLAAEEGATVPYVAKILAQMKPPLDATPLPARDDAAEDQPADEAIEGMHRHVVAGLPEDPEIVYHVQLPPEYNPYRKYPLVVTLHGAGTNAAQQIDWWAGTYRAETKMRYGQGSRHGYIVVAPEWTREHQRSYEFSAREHAAVMYSLRDALRRYSVDTDRVFLSGHSMGGDAAWDIGIAHPDLWAGVIPVVATGDKYIFHYTKNAKMVPLYFISGQLDGDKRQKNASEWDLYLGRPGFDAMLVEYQGRGHEHFYEEVQHVLEWMRVHKRNFFPKEFTTSTMRPWDTFFWWVEIDKLPAAASIHPVDWMKVDHARAIETTGKVLATNALSVNSGAGKVTAYLSPENIDFNHPEQRPAVIIKNKRFANILPSLEVLLEDARTRADRLHPFWAKVTN